MKSFVILCFLSLLNSRQARADILFVNINLNFQEEEVARKAALARHENLIVIPVLTDEQKKFLTALKKADGDGIHSDAKLNKVFPRGLPNMQAEIEKALAKLDQDHRPLTSFIITSHHVNKFYGAIGAVDDLELYHQLATHPSSKSLGAFYGWGCYTTEPQVAIEIKRDLPQVKILAGWDGVAPAESRAADTGILAYMLAHENQAIDAANKHILRRYLGSIPFVGKSLGITNFGLDVCSDLETPHESISNISDLTKLCTHRALFGDGHGFGLMGMYNWTYVQYNSGNQPIPTNLENSDLRKFYNLAKIFSVCPDIQNMRRAHQFPSEAQIVHLIHFKNGYDNFLQFYKKDIDHVSDLLQANKYSGTRLSEGMNKKQLRAYRNTLLQLATRLSQQKPTFWQFWLPHPSEADIQALRTMASNIDTLLLQNKCLPDYWNDPLGDRQVSAPDPQCLAHPF